MKPNLMPMKHKKKEKISTKTSSMKRWEKHSCTIKKYYYTHRDAAKNAHFYEQKYHKKCRVYHCPFCKKYHISTKG